MRTDRNQLRFNQALLAFVNLAFGFCLGCFLYLHLRYARALFTGK